jgi:hypothetical protein
MINDCYGLGLPLLMTAILLASAVIDFLCSTKIALAIIRQNLCQSPSLTQSPQQNFRIKAHTKMGTSPKLNASLRDVPSDHIRYQARGPQSLPNAGTPSP